MDTIAAYLVDILSTNLLAPSASALRTPLGYAGASTLYRIAGGKASSKAIINFCNRLYNAYNLTTENLEQMYNIIYFARRLNQIMKHALSPQSPDKPFVVVKAFIEADYGIFTPEFVENGLIEWLELKRSNTEAFFSMLAYYYVWKTKTPFYNKNLTFRQECASILEPLGEQLMDLHPGNIAAFNFVYAYSKTNIYGNEAPILWNLVTAMGAMFMVFAEPIESLRSEDQTILLPGLQSRSYWRGKDKDSLILSLATDNLREGCGGYEIFTIDPESLRIHSLYNISFTEEVCYLYAKNDFSIKHGTYVWDGKTLSTQWYDDNIKELAVGNSWSLMSLKQSRSLRELNDAITDEMLRQASASAEDCDTIPGYEVDDVAVTREKLSLILRNGCVFTIPIKEAPFLEKVLPSEHVNIYRTRSDGEMLVFWHRLRHCLPLSDFTEEV